MTKKIEKKTPYFILREGPIIIGLFRDHNDISTYIKKYRNKFDWLWRLIFKIKIEDEEINEIEGTNYTWEDVKTYLCEKASDSEFFKACFYEQDPCDIAKLSCTAITCYHYEE